MKNKIILGAICLVLGGLIGYALHPDAPVTNFGTSTAGSTFTTAKLPAVAINLVNPGANGTSTSILNNTGQAQYISSIKAFCTGVGTSQSANVGAGLLALTLSVGTTSTAAPAVIPTNLVGNNAITIATSSSYFSLSSSTSAFPGNGTGFNVWGNGSYLTFWFNATNTAACTVGVDTLSS